MDSAANDSQYLPSQESEGSFDEDEEEDERPNRWRGPKSTWQHLNSQEINTLTALKEICDRDLSVHLYNAFALKRRYKRVQHGAVPGGPVPDKDVNVATGQPVEPDDWLPQRSWTAWPMRVDKVPPPNDPARLGMYDPDEKFTFRHPARVMPSTALEEVISGEILKSAKEKFNARPWAEPSASDEEDTDSERGTEDEVSDEVTVKSPLSSKSKRSQSRSRSRPRSVKSELMSQDDKMDDPDEQNPEGDDHDEPNKKRRFKPTVSMDDDLSYDLLRPSVRHILTKLGTALTILHNAQEAALRYQSDSGDSESDVSIRNASSRRSLSRQGRQTPTRKAGRPLGAVSQARSHRRASSPAQEHADENQESKAPGKGRRKKVYPRLEGETDREYAVRIARLRKEALPVFSDEEPVAGQEAGSAAESEPGRESGNSGDGEETEGPSRARVKKRKRIAPATRDRRSPSATSSASNTGRRGARMKTRIGLRDWKDVLGAAALAGFPAAAVDRAARRCADLFGQSMTLQTLIEGPAASGRKTPVRETTYVPGMPRPPLLEEDEEEDAQRIPMRATRTPSAAPSPTPEGSPGPARPRATRSRSGSASSPGSYLCSFRDCPRAAEGEGFSRRNNLVRHMKLVHGWTPSERGGGGEDQSAAASALMMMPDEVDSEDEMHGAVHVDWFLRPVKLQQGWRGADEEEPKRRRAGQGRRRGRPRSQAKGGETGVTDDDGDVGMGEDS
ncbi:RNA polymerase I-specific transcription initiation factor-domain-containing protein [Hypoxylon cercidicola]|nr:RNA polymerase I-specific transcription initiation factor-domain-containing protein [Hypoxylon cercidicola]